MAMRESTERFTDRVSDYLRFRPTYPAALGATLSDEVGLSSSSVVADVGSGTGISTAVLLDLGAEVHAVEPNDAMRHAAERLLGARNGFHSVAGTAEATTLPAASCDLVTAGQAFHWFDIDAAGVEFRRILRPGAPTALFWNRRSVDGSSFLVGYEDLLQRYGTDYEEVRHDRYDAAVFDAFFRRGWKRWAFPNTQELDRRALFGRVFSSSYTPPPEHPDRGPMERALGELFARESREGHVRMEYQTELYLGSC
jgi:SAM-dependent methyltransferase